VAEILARGANKAKVDCADPDDERRGLECGCWIHEMERGPQTAAWLLLAGRAGRPVAEAGDSRGAGKAMEIDRT